MATTILLIHGINNQENSKENIERTWSDALKIGAAEAGLVMPNGVKFLAAFYGDVLFDQSESWNKNKTSVLPMSAESPDEDYANDEVAALYLEFQRKYNISDEQVSGELQGEDNIQTRRRMAKGIHKRWLKAIARTLENVLPLKGRIVAKVFLRQAAAYLHKPGLKENIDNTVKEQILDGLSNDDNVIIISHSLGTIVAYALMLRLRHEVQTKLLLTAGSPLGIEIVKRRLGPPLMCPPNVDRWVNASDREDFVALEPKLTRATFGCTKIMNIDDLDNGNENAHDILKYLSHSVVAREVVLAAN